MEHLIQKQLELQKQLDSRIIEEKGLQDKDLFESTCANLIGEIAEFLNETRWLKHWSVKGPSEKHIVLEEFVDGLHFFNSLANMLGIPADELDFDEVYVSDTKAATINKLYYKIARMGVNYNEHQFKFNIVRFDFFDAYQLYISIGVIYCGYTFSEIHNAYLTKNKINHERQDSKTY